MNHPFEGGVKGRSMKSSFNLFSGTLAAFAIALVSVMILSRSRPSTASSSCILLTARITSRSLAYTTKTSLSATKGSPSWSLDDLTAVLVNLKRLPTKRRSTSLFIDMTLKYLCSHTEINADNKPENKTVTIATRLSMTVADYGARSTAIQPSRTRPCNYIPSYSRSVGVAQPADRTSACSSTVRVARSCLSGG